MLIGDIQGIIFSDVNGNGVNDGEPGLAGLTAYLDQNQNAQLDAGESSTTTDGGGAYRFPAVADGNYTVAHLLPANTIQSAPAGGSGVGVLGQAVDALAGFGVDPVGVAWANGWLYQVDRGAGAADPNTLYQIDPASGAALGSFVIPGEVLRLTFDGVDFWGADSTNGLIYRFSTTGTTLQTLTPPAAGSGTVAWDAQRGRLWVGSFNTDLIYELNVGNPQAVEAGDGAVVSTIPAPHQNVNGLAFDGRQLWVSGQSQSDGTDAFTYQISRATGQVLRSFTAPHYDFGSRFISDLAFDGHYLWSIDRNSRSLVQVDPGIPESREVIVAGGSVGVGEFGVFPLASITGQVFSDEANLGVKDAGEVGLAGWRAFLDLDVNGRFEPWEPATISDSSGTYTLTGVRPGSHTLAETVRAPGYAQTAPTGNSYVFTVSSSATVSGRDFGNHILVGVVGPRGPEMLVNVTTAGLQETPNRFASASVQTVAMDSAGNSVVVWSGSGPGDADGIFARRYDDAGNTIGTEFQVNTTTTGQQINPMVAMANDGRFVVAWSGSGINDLVRAQLFDGSGAPRGNEIDVSATTAFANSLAMDDDGNFVVLYDARDTFYTAQLYDAQGQAQGTPIAIPGAFILGAGSQVAMDADGDFAVTFAGASGVVVIRFDRFGQPQGPLINVTTNGRHPMIAMDQVGNFAVCWNQADGTQWAKLFFAAGTPRGAPFPVAVTGELQRVGMAMEADGDFFVVGGLFNVLAQRFQADGKAIDASPYPINTTIARPQQGAAVAVDGSGRFSVAWSGNGVGDDTGVFVQSYAIIRPWPTLVRIADVTQPEGNSGTSTFVFTAIRFGDTSGITTVDWTTSDATATAANGDYVGNTGQVVFKPGETTQTIQITVNGDMVIEGDETFLVRLTNASRGGIADDTGIGTILNDDLSNPYDRNSPPEGVYVWDIGIQAGVRDGRADLRVSVLVRRDSDADGLAEETDAIVPGAYLRLLVSGGSGRESHGFTNEFGEFLSEWLGPLPEARYIAEVWWLSHSNYYWKESLDPTALDADENLNGRPEQPFLILNDWVLILGVAFQPNNPLESIHNGPARGLSYESQT